MACRSWFSSPLFGDHQRGGDRARAQLDAEGIVMTRLRAPKGDIAGLAGGLLSQCLTDKQLLGGRHAPWSSGKAANGDARGADPVAVHLKRDRRRGEREGI